MNRITLNGKIANDFMLAAMRAETTEITMLAKADNALRLTCKFLRGSTNPDHIRATKLAEEWLDEYHTWMTK